MIDTYQPGQATTRTTVDLVQAVPALRPILDECAARPDDVPASIVWADFRHVLVGSGVLRGGGCEHAALGAIVPPALFVSAA